MLLSQNAVPGHRLQTSLHFPTPAVPPQTAARTGRPSLICRACLLGQDGASTRPLQQLREQCWRRTARRKLRKALPDWAPLSSAEAGHIPVHDRLSSCKGH